MILIKGGRMMNPKTGTDELRDLVIDGNRIKYIGKFSPDEKYEQIIHAEGMVVAPGLIDVHVHFRDPGLTYKEDIESGANAAARGGFTTVVCMANTKPIVDNKQVLFNVMESAKKAIIHVHTAAAVSKGFEGKELTNMAELKMLGAVGFSDDGFPLTDTAFVRQAMLAVKALDIPISLHEEDPALIGQPGINDGEIAASLGFIGALASSESAMVARDCMLAVDTGAKVHIQHVSCKESVAAIKLAKSLGANITAETTPQHFSLTQDEVLVQGSLAKLNPPLRSETDRYSLIAGLKDGTIDIIATDHAPHSAEEKSRPFPTAPSGIIGLETALSLGITNLVRKGHLSLIDLLGKMTLAPAELYGFDSGYLAEGGYADIVIFDAKENWVVSNFLSKSANSPFIGKSLFGKVKYTICSGKIVYKD